MKNIGLYVVLMAAFATPLILGACTCVKPTAKEGLKYADIAFRGELIEHHGSVAVFRVDESWKGNPGSSVEFEWHDGTHGDCDGFWPRLLKVGNKLLVFGRGDGRGLYHANICLPQRFVSESEEELKELGPGKPPRKD